MVPWSKVLTPKDQIVKHPALALLLNSGWSGHPQAAEKRGRGRGELQSCEFKVSDSGSWLAVPSSGYMA